MIEAENLFSVKQGKQKKSTTANNHHHFICTYTARVPRQKHGCKRETRGEERDTVG
jgi:hypothetical protein